MANYVLPPKFVYGSIVDGDGYLIPSLMDVPANGSKNIHIKNPHPDKVLWFAAMTITAEGSCEFYLHDHFNSITEGTEITIQNALMNEENGGIDSGPFEAYQDSTYDAATSYPIGFTTSTGAAKSHGVEIVATTMEPGREMVVEIQNQDSSSNKALFATLVLSSY